MHDAPLHAPVLLKETVSLLDVKKGRRVLDATVGLGGHSEALLGVIGRQGHLTALDADEQNLSHAQSRLGAFTDQVTFVHANFRDIPACLPEHQRTFDAILADLGLSSPHIDDPARGFSFRGDAPLDMRFDRRSGATAADLLQHASPEDLLTLLRTLGEVPSPRRFVGAIVEARARGPLRTSGDLTRLVEASFGYRAPSVLPRIFQALRITVNDEIGSLKAFLAAAPALLASGGRLAIISYHSLEDRMVKQAFRGLSEDTKDEITGAVKQRAPFELLTKRPVTAGAQELAENPRARSAKLRVLAKR